MPASRLLAAFAAGALVTVPGLALAQGGSPFETPPAETPPVEVPSPDDLEVEEEPEELEVEEEPEEPEEPEVEVEDELEVEAEGDDEGHGETISALAECLPSGAELHGTGFNKGFVMSQAASTGQVVIEAHDIDATVETPEDAQALCDELAPIIAEAEAPDTATGRPDWAGPDDDADEGGDLEAEEAGDAERGGPPPWAGKPGGPKGPR